jgi:hypothetical protein
MNKNFTRWVTGGMGQLVVCFVNCKGLSFRPKVRFAILYIGRFKTREELDKILKNL